MDDFHSFLQKMKRFSHHYYCLGFPISGVLYMCVCVCGIEQNVLTEELNNFILIIGSNFNVISIA